MKTTEEDFESDNSVDTDELNDVNEEVYETKVKKGIDRTTNKTVKVKKSKPIPIKKKPVKQIKEDLKEELVEEEVVNEVVEEEPVKPKKSLSETRLANLEKARKARMDKAKMAKSAVNDIKKKIKKEIPEKTVYKEKIIYMIPTNNGFIETDSIPKLSKKEMKYLDNDDMVSKEELEVGKKILRRKDGTADLRSKAKRQQTEKQREATKKMLEANKKRREAKKKEKQETLGKEIKKAVVDVVTKPIEQVKKEIEKTEPEKKIYDFSKIIPYY